MHPISTFTTLLLGIAMLALATVQGTYFKCDSSQGSGFSPKCCTDINGQVGINCKIPNSSDISQLQHPHVKLQVSGYKNPYTNVTLDLCSMRVDYI
ncbi:hypothetical protein F5B18DRAFT_656305 [Nemania serpens]|nr:hypothetical protein F5B18DRAFT_656305 [Nemania serpens]